MRDDPCVEQILRIEGLRLVVDTLAYRVFRTYSCVNESQRSEIITKLRVLSDELDTMAHRGRLPDCPLNTVLIDGMCVPT